MPKSVSALSSADEAPSSVRASDRSVDVAVENVGRHEPVNFEALFPIGSIVDNKYRIDAVLGRGGMGLVVAATHTELNEVFAIKFLYVRGGETNEYRSRFRREAQVSARIRSEHVTRVLDVGVSHNTMFMVMEHLSGNDLRSTLRVSSPMPLPQVIDLVVQTCQGVVEAHAHGIVHRDLKPSNVFLTHRSDGSDLVKILDFGVSKWSAVSEGISDLTETGALLGSPKYMAPEQIFGASGVDARADLWSVACIVYEMFAGRPPYDEPSLTLLCAALAQNRQPPSLLALRPDLPPALEAAILRGLVIDRDKRTPNLAVFAGEILAAVGSPAAAEVQARLEATLGRAGTRATPATSSGAHPALARTGSSGNAYLPATEWAASQSGSLPGVKPARPKGLVAAVAVIALLVTGSAAYVLGSNGRAHESAKVDITAVPSAAPAPLATPPKPVDEAPYLAAAPPPPAPGAAMSNIGGATPSASATTTAAATTPTPTPTPVARRAPEVRAAPRPTARAPEPTVAAPAAAPPPATPPPATTEPTPAAPKRTRMPLQDRQ